MRLGVRGTLLLAVLGVTACGAPQPVVKPPPPPDPAAAAEAHLAAGNYAAAAAEYERLASSIGGETAARYRMQAALAHQDAGDIASANALIETPPPVDPQAAVLQRLANARRLLHERMPEQALEQLRPLSASRLTPYQTRIRDLTAGRAEHLSGNYTRAVDALLAADEGAWPDDARAALQQEIWDAVSRLPDKELAALAAAGDPVRAGWGVLGLTTRRNLHDPSAFPNRIAQWQQRFPGHRAHGVVIEPLLEVSERVTVRPKHVALLLPFDTRFGGAAKAVRDGFLTAWYSDPDLGARPAVAIYGADDGSINETYARAVAAGADLVVGPLSKSAVAILASKTDRTVPVLALNETEGAAASLDAAGLLAPGFYQFGLVPEDEARQAASRAWSDGHTRAIALVPDSSWGERLLGAFAAQWRTLGGTVLGRIVYTNDVSTYAVSVKQALNIDLSEARAAALVRLLGRRLEFEPRRRADVDCIFLGGFPLDARQLLPQLRYYRAEDVPVYATSHVFTGVVDAGRDQDLDGVIFGDMPWLVGAADLDRFDAVRRLWPEESVQFRRLFALGIDAYRLIPHLSRMRLQPGLRVPGATGSLHMDASGKIHRELSWLRFADGVPGMLGIGLE